MTSRKQLDEELQAKCEQYANDPLGFVRFFFDWGYGELKGEEGPDAWQADVLNEIGAYCKKAIRAEAGVAENPGPLQAAIASGHGIGKSALVAWVILWFMSCRDHPQIVVTANTEQQLTTRTWRELSRWHKRIHNKAWFTWTATKFYHNSHPEDWFASATPWSETNPEAFAGTHEKHVMMIFDEASRVHDVIWEKVDGAMSTFGAMWLAFGNPTRNVGRFYDCFHKDKKFWVTRQIDSRNAKKADKVWIARFIERLGLTDDRTKYQILGQFPSTSAHQLISPASVEKCQNHISEGNEFTPLVMGVDVARFGENNSVVCLRQGRKVLDFIVLPKRDLMETANWVAGFIRQHRPLTVFVDESGLGAGVLDRLNQLGFSNVVGVNSGNESPHPRFLNMRAYMWWEMKEKLDSLIELPKGDSIQGVTLKDELCVVEYDYTKKGGRLFLKSKKDIMDEHGFSPDRGDALAMTYAYNVADYDSEGEHLEPPTYAD